MSTITRNFQAVNRLEPTDASEASGDLELLERFRAHADAEAFGRIAHRHAAAVYATCLRILGDSASAEDAAQETFFRLLRHPTEVNRSVGAWLHRTATNVSLDIRRSDTSRRRRELICGLADSRWGSLESVGESSRQASTWAELSPAIDQALSEMPEELRTILVEHYLLGRSQAELAQESGQCPATICRRVRRGMEELRRRLRLKGIDALPVILVGLLCQVAARQAPAAVLEGVAKMSLLGPTDPALPARAASRAARAPVHAPNVHATAAQQILAGTFWVGVSLGVIALLVSMGIGVAHGVSGAHMASAPPELVNRADIGSSPTVPHGR
jgi:RNA polymerase sigma factor (sigma-70 family)